MYHPTKRLIDIVFSTAVLIIALPVFVLIILLLLITGDGHIFYRQERIGYKTRPFYILKFATMQKDSDHTGTRDVTVKNDPRLLPLGKILRKTKLNELPQLINILKGDMTLIGPRPLMPKGFLRYTEDVRNVIYNIKPGLTGIGSIIFCHEVKLVATNTDHETLYRNINKQKGRLEIWYQQNQGVRIDLLILFLTAVSIVYPAQKLTYRMFKTLPVLEMEMMSPLPVSQVARKRLNQEMDLQSSFS